MMDDLEVDDLMVMALVIHLVQSALEQRLYVVVNVAIVNLPVLVYRYFQVSHICLAAHMAIAQLTL